MHAWCVPSKSGVATQIEHEPEGHARICENRIVRFQEPDGMFCRDRR
jgi:hypothetical protein